ncbi:MAG TPA: FHA domain-containing protein, partial [Vicinamibacteria bacterium]|nr:FHA domain-containing protein [Vicinamibacteria bacterium]
GLGVTAMDACPSCGAPLAASPGRATRRCERCGRVTVAAGSAATGPAGDEPQTAPFLEPAAEGDLPTSVGVAGPLLRLPEGKRVAVAILSGARKGEAVALAQPSLTIGRDGGGADLALPDPDVSRRHAAIECHGARIVLRDLGSRNGTWMGEDRVSQREIEDRTEFRLGATALMLLVTDP